MRPNLSPLDRDVRAAIVAPLALIIGLAIGPLTVTGVFAIALAIWSAVTSAVGFDPINRAFGARPVA